ncbi:hypothetical protein UlMin_024901 [Ulmus minor]
MECNKDEAVRAKEIAERKFREKDYTAAKKFALKAQNLYPGLDGLAQMFTTLEVYISAENKISGEADWYGILGVNPWDNDDTIRKQYRKLALMLHPDKNKSIGAEGAFKLVSEAWSLLSDKNKRLAYNQKRNAKGDRPKVSNQTRGRHPSEAPAANGFHFTNKVTSNVRTQQSTMSGFTSAPSYKKADTFWTICNKCKTHYEYLRIYLNHTLLCPNCREAFMALEKAPPPNVFKPSNLSSHQQHQEARNFAASNNQFNAGKKIPTAQTSKAGVSSGANSFNQTNFQWGHFSDPTGAVKTAAAPSAAAQAADVVQQASEKVKRDREERQSVAEWERSHLYKTMGSSFTEDRHLKNRKLESNNLNGYEGYMANGMGHGSGVNFGKDRFFSMPSIHIKPNSRRELSYPELRQMMMEKARTEIKKKLAEKRNSLSKASTGNKEKQLLKDPVRKKQKKMVNGDKRDKSVVINEKSVADDSADTKDKEATLPTTINVPDSDFHNFDDDRTEASFGEEQVWAGYDDDDGMPRFYARIHKVLSLNPFKMRISWLNSRSCSEFGPIDWVGSGFAKTCGEFRIGRYEFTKALNAFSHQVSWTKGPRGAVQIYPKKGEVWALYKNWSPDWNEQTPDEEIHKYDMVEVLTDYNEETGVSVAPLVKVAGFRAVFRTNMDPKEAKKIPKEEMLRFSHQVPNYLLTGEEADNAPKGCRELDPAATSLDLLQVITEASEALPEAENGGKAEEEIAQSPEGEFMEIDSEAMETDSANGKQPKEEEMTADGEQTKDER